MEVQTARRCPACAETKDAAAFSPQGAYCKPCAAAKQRQRRLQFPEAARANDRAKWARMTPEERDAERLRRKRWRDDNPELHRSRNRASHIKTRYGMTMAEYDAKLAAGCVICGSHNRMGIDHNHANGKVRDALCGRCNSALGFMNDDPERARALIAYLDTHKD